VSAKAGSPGAGRFGRLGRAWGSLALVVLNTCLLLVVLNLVLFLVFRVLDGRRARPHREARSPEALSRHGEVHPGLDRDEIRALWEETYLASSGFVYEPFTQFRVKAFAGRYVTIDPQGFRRHPGVGPWPPGREALNVFLYGGSTAFGYGVPDDRTVAAHLQRYLAERPGGRGLGRPVQVYNFGRSGYFSTQERLLFERQLTLGTGPDVAVFLDGLNDCRIADKLPIFSARLEARFQGGDGALGSLLARLPMMRLARAVAGAVRRPPASAPAPPTALEETIADLTVDTYLANRRIIEAVASTHGVDARFVWQPVSFYAYDRRHHLFADREEPPHVRAGYQRMAALAGDGQLGESFLWLADMQAGIEEPLYVDPAHYSGEMSRRVAVEIGDWMLSQGVLIDRSRADAGEGLATASHPTGQAQSEAPLEVERESGEREAARGGEQNR
jgi:hypothetical protein